MLKFLKRLPPEGTHYRLERTDIGYALGRKEDADPTIFNDLAREAIGLAGEEFVAMPRLDEKADYDQVIIIPLD